MVVADMAEALSLKVLSGDAQREITGCYIGDLLSWVMSHAQSGEVWITIMSNINVVAVASLTDVACVVVAEGAEVDGDVLQTAAQKDVCILQSEKTVFELAAGMAKILPLV